MLQQAVGRLSQTLDMVRAAIGEGLDVSDWDAVNTALLRLFRRGRVVARALFGNSSSQRRFSEGFRKLWPGWATEPAGSAQLQIHVRRGLAVPAEIVPIFDLDEPDTSIGSLSELLRFARRFPGYSMNVVRDVEVPGRARGRCLSASPALGVVVFADQTLPGAREELAFFRRLHAHLDVDVDGPWPRAGVALSNRAFAARLHDPTRSFDGTTRRSEDRIIHLSCHCTAEPPASAVLVEDVEVRLADEEGNEWPANMGRVQGAWSGMEGMDDRDRPLVVFNACGTSAMDPTTMFSLPLLFLEEGHLGFIGTEAPVPDAVAAAFSRMFYGALLQGHTVATAVRNARWSLLRRHRNPLGLLYVAFATPDLRVRPPLVQA